MLVGFLGRGVVAEHLLNVADAAVGAGRLRADRHGGPFRGVKALVKLHGLEQDLLAKPLHARLLEQAFLGDARQQHLTGGEGLLEVLIGAVALFFGLDLGVDGQHTRGLFFVAGLEGEDSLPLALITRLESVVALVLRLPPQDE